MTRSERQAALVPFSVIAFIASFGAATAVVFASGYSADPVAWTAYSFSSFGLLAAFGMAMKATLAGSAESSASRVDSTQGILGALIAQTATIIGYAGGLSDRVELELVGVGAAVLLAALLVQTKIARASRPAIAGGLAATFASIAAAWLGINGFGAAILFVFFIWIAQFSIAVNKIAATSRVRYTFAVFTLTAWIAFAVIVIAIFSARLRF